MSKYLIARTVDAVGEQWKLEWYIVYNITARRYISVVMLLFEHDKYVYSNHQLLVDRKHNMNHFKIVPIPGGTDFYTECAYIVLSVLHV